MQICPHCASANIYYSKKNRIYICEDCDNSFAAPAADRGTRLFISYGHDKNQILVSKIKDYLTEKGYDVWIDTSCIPKGEDWRERVTNGLIASNGVIAFLSKHSVRNPGVCLDELRIAVMLKRAFVQSVLLESSETIRLPYHLDDRQWINMEDWASVPPEQWNTYFEQKMQELITALKSNSSLHYEEEMNRIADSLQVLNSIAKEQHLLREHFVGREWLTEKVLDWFENGSNSRMVIFGVPGSGKSAFSANLAEYHPDTIVSLFIEWDSTYTSSTNNLIRLFAFKLAGALSDYRKMLIDMLDDKDFNKKITELSAGDLFNYIILDPLSCCIDGERSRSLIIIDGLDEAEDAAAKLFFKKAAQFPEWIRFLFTTRFDDTSRQYYASAEALYLDNTSKLNHQDIARYAAYRLSLEPQSNTAALIAQKAEGSFIYAKTLCDAILGGQISQNDIQGIPLSLGGFYLEFFGRVFPSPKAYSAVRPFFELLATEGELYETVVCVCLGLDKYALWELRTNLKSLVVTGVVKHRGKEHRVLRFSHKSIKDWITDRSLAGEYYVDSKKGYGTMAITCEALKRDKSKFLESIPDFYSENHADDLKWMLENDYPCLLAKAGRYDDYKNLLKASFDIDKSNENGFDDYQLYYSFESMWRLADRMPLTVSIDDLKPTLEAILTYPHSRMCSQFAHRSFQISLLLLKELMETGRFQDMFYLFMGKIRYSAYFQSSASDMDGETRDGWDKFYMARDANVCLKKLDDLHALVPVSVRRECERMKLTFHYYMGKPYSMFSYHETDVTGCFFGLFHENGFYKDICTYEPDDDDNDSISELVADYNTASLRYYLGIGSDEDEAFVTACAARFANVSLACDLASADLKTIKREKTTERLQYIEHIREKYAAE